METLLEDDVFANSLEDNPYENVSQSVFGSVYYAAKEGFSLNLMNILTMFDDPLIRNYIVNAHFIEDDGQSFTPLAIAATKNRLPVVKSLLSNFHLDLEKESIVKFDGHIIIGATALWCAAGAGHMNIVKLLIKHGANVNHLTRAKSSPIRAACFQGRLDIVRYLVAHGADVSKPNIYNNTCLMISAYKGYSDIVEFLLEENADPNEQALCGATSLHYAAECGHLQICQLLLDYGAVFFTNELGLNPLMTAAERMHELIVEMFFNRSDLNLSKHQKIDALELMGASFGNDKDNYDVILAYKYLMMGMMMRFEDTQSVTRKTVIEPIPAYENWVESQNVQDLQAIRLNHNSIHMESLTIRERILGKLYPDLPQHIIFRGAIYADQARFDRCESLWLYALQLRQINRISCVRDLLRFAQLYSQMFHLNHQIHVSSILSVLNACIQELEENQRKIADPGPKDDVDVIGDEYDRNVLTTIYIIMIITKLLKKNTMLYKSDMAILLKLICRLIKSNIRASNGQTMLHLTVNGVTPVDDFHTRDVCRFPCPDTAQLLITCGASLAATDCERNTPLHILAKNNRNMVPGNDEFLLNISAIIACFVSSGAHADAVNKNGLTAANLSPIKEVESMIKSHEIATTTLKCLSSRSIALYKLPYKGKVPKDLESFVEMHCAEKIS